MISYRELAMRVLGKPLHISGHSAPPPPHTHTHTSHRVTALALTAAMVAGMSAPAFAGTYWTGNGDITVTKDTDGKVYVQQGSGDRKEDTDGNVTITSDESIYNAAQNSKSGTSQQSSTDNAAATQEAKEDAQPVVTDEDTSGQESMDSDQTPEEKDTDPSGSSSDHSETPEDAEDKSAAPEEETESDGEEEAEEDSETEDKTGSEESSGQESVDSDQTPEEKDTDPSDSSSDHSEQPAFDTMELKGGSTPVSEEKEETYDKAPTTFAEKMSANFDATVKSTTSAIIKIINNLKNTSAKDNTLNVTLDNVTVDATNNSGQSVTALTVSGEGDTTLTLKGDNHLTGKGGSSGLHKDDHYNTLTITGDGSLTTKGGAGTDGGLTGGYGIYTNGDLVLAGSGTITAIGGSIADNASYSGSGGYGIYSNANLTITGGTITATGGDGHGSNYYGDGRYGGNGIDASSSITISGTKTTISATGGSGSSIAGATNSTGGTGGYGISSSKITINDGANIELAQGGKGGANTNGKGGKGGDGIDGGISSGLTISSGTIKNAQGGTGGNGGNGNGGNGGNGISGSLTMSAGTIENAQGGNGGGSTGSGNGGNGGNGISGSLTISGGSIQKAQGGSGGDSSNGKGGNGGHGSGSSTTMSGGSITAQGGNGGSNGGDGGNGIGQTYSSATISGGTLKATGGNGTGNDGKGIGSTYTVSITNEAADVDVTVRGGVAASTKTIELTCRHAGTVTIYNDLSPTSANETYTAPGHKWNNGSTTIPATGSANGVKTYTCTVCNATRTEAIPATGEVPTENGGQPASGENSDSENGSSTIYTGLRVLNENNVNIIQDTRQVTLTQISGILYIDAKQDTASLDGVLADLSALMTDNVRTLVFSTNGRTSTLHLPELTALGAGGAQFTLTHSGSSATLTVGGVQHNELIH